ncbi:aminopeptidase N-like isoform X2 [Prorops nasuta]|uniref:aminopeptidase N-like isoform X2 n=1 Tax=Prorops nasuta TaxID=863751 RepID=UPI0034CE3DEA
MDHSNSQHGIVEVTLQAYEKRYGASRRSRCSQIRTGTVVLTIGCVLIISLILYWFIHSIVDTQHGDSRDKPIHSTAPNRLSRIERLTDNVLPTEYDLKIIPILQEGNFTFIGEIDIQIHCKNPTKHFRLHSRGLHINELSIEEYQSLNGTKRIANKYALTDDNILDIFLFQILIPGDSYVLRLKFTGLLNDSEKGLFRSSCVDKETNGKSWIVLSAFTPDYAQNAFPCFDEPWIKTPFRISIGRQSHMRSHSNSMRKVVEEIYDLPGYEWDHYEKTFPMSTFAVAIFVTNFVNRTIVGPTRPSYTIFSQKEVQDNSSWGLLIANEQFAVDRDTSELIERKRATASITAYFLALQWFGFLVSPKWWNDYWITQGLSTFFSFLAINEIEPSWNFEETFTTTCQNAFTYESYKNVEPIHANLSTKSLLEDITSCNANMKSSCVIYMMYNFLGKTAFLSSIRRYIQAYYYRSADEADLWRVFQEEITLRRSLPEDLAISDVMKTWTHQAGFPFLTVKRNPENGTVRVQQSHFRASNCEFDRTSEQLWFIPLSWTSNNDHQLSYAGPQVWLREKYMEINDTILSNAILSNQWILFNIDQSGFYRINYDEENWKLLTNSFNELPTITKSQLLSDSFAMANVGLLNQSLAWSILSKLRNESKKVVWLGAFESLTDIKNRMWDSNGFKYTMCKLLEDVYSLHARALTYKSPNDWTNFETTLMQWACLGGHKTCLTITRSFVLKMLRNESTSSIPLQFRSWAYCMFVQHATENQWSMLYNKYQDIDLLDREQLAFGLGCHRNITILHKYISDLELEKKKDDSDEKIAKRALISLSENPFGYYVLLSYFKSHWSNIDESSQEKLPFYANFISTHMDQKPDIDLLSRFQELINQSKDKVVKESMKNIFVDTIAKVNINIAWNQKYKDQVLRILNQHVQDLPESKDCRREGFDMMLL